MIYHHSRLHFRQSEFLNREREEQQGSQNMYRYQNEIYFVSFSFCQNVIIYIIVYANHCLSLPKLSKFCLDFVSILAGGHIMDQRREKNGGVSTLLMPPFRPDICFHCFCLLSASAKSRAEPSSESLSAQWFGLEDYGGRSDHHFT